MNLKDILVAIVPVVSIFVSGFVSWFIARSTADKEIKKLELSWKHEDRMASDTKFSEMCGAVSQYTATRRRADHVAACTSIIETLPITQGELSEALFALYVVVHNDSASNNEINVLLKDAIDEKQKSKLT